MVSTSLSEWNIDVLQKLCMSGQSESDRHDFKFTIAELRDPEKICCAFANSEGGFIVVGVKEIKGRFEVIGIPPNKELYSDFLKRIKIEPSLDIPAPLVLDIPHSENIIYIFEIPKSLRRPHIPARAEKRFFYKRRGANCEQMTLEEIRYQIHNFEEKKDKLTLLLIELNSIRDLLIQESSCDIDSYIPQIYSVDVINSLVVETYSFLKIDLGNFRALATIKNISTCLNSEKTKLSNAMAMSYTLDSKSKFIKNYRDYQIQNMDRVITAIISIEDSLLREYNISNPFPKQINWNSDI